MSKNTLCSISGIPFSKEREFFVNFFFFLFKTSSAHISFMSNCIWCSAAFNLQRKKKTGKQKIDTEKEKVQDNS